MSTWNVTDNGHDAAHPVIRHTDNTDRYEFGRWRFNSDTDDLNDGETTTSLEPQVAKLLRYFLSHQHTVISRDEIITAVWDGRVVSDDAINRCVSILRQILSPQNKNAYIETVVRKGYLSHFPAPLELKRHLVPPFGRRSYRLLAAFTGVVAIILYIGAGKFGGPNLNIDTAPGGALPMVAVLPFSSASQTGDDEFFAKGVHDDLLTQLGKLQSMRVISSTSVREYRNIPRNLRTIGEELGADVIVEGNVQLAADRIRINVQLIDTRTNQHLWAESYDRDLSPANIFDVQSEIARTIAAELHTTMTAQDSKQLALIPTENMAAYLAYHRAMELREPAGSNIGSPQYLEELEEAVALDPNFSRAWAELVIVLAYLNIGGDKPDMTLRAEQALAQLQTIAPGSADHLIGQAAYVYYALKDYDRAHDIISRALTMNPSNVNAVQLKSWIERRQGDFAAFLNSKREARSLDPRNTALLNTLLQGLVITHRYDEAWAEIEASPLESFVKSSTQNFLLFRQYRDFQRLQESMRELCSFYARTDCGWTAHVANRDYLAALDSLDKAEEGTAKPSLSASDRRRIFTYWLMGKDDLLKQGLPQWNNKLDKNRDDSGDFVDPENSYIGLAMLAGALGKADESARLIQHWYRVEPIDWAVRAGSRHEACRVLGMIAATHAAVKCLREGLTEASAVTSFFEPYLPFYDSLRQEREFIEMLADIDGGGQRARAGH